MGNCTVSKLTGAGEEEVVTLCRERKNLLKAAVDGRYALAEAHAKYTHSLCAVAAAINLFVTRHSTPTPILITLPPPSPPSFDPSFLKQTPTEPKTEAVMYRTSCSSSPCSSPSSSCSCLAGEGVRGGEVNGVMGQDGDLGCGFFFAGSMVPTSPAPEGSFGWDFFNPFDGVRVAEEAVMMVGLGRSSDEELRAVREEEGIPELEEEEEDDESKRVCGGAEKNGDRDGKVVPLNVDVSVGCGTEVVKVDGSGCSVGEKEMTMVDGLVRERELLEALRDVEDHFVKAYKSGEDVTRMLEAKHIAPVCSDLHDVKENPSKLIQVITWHRSPSSRSLSYKSSLASSSRSTSFEESKVDLFDDCGGMESGTHSHTLGRLYAWEKKLYEEVKAGEETRKLYERKCSQLRNRDAKVTESRSVRVAAKDLHTRILVAIRSAETISEKIQQLRDRELQPQLIELLQGLKKTWKVMLESHDMQNQIMREVKSFTCPSHGKFSSDAHRFTTLQLDAELEKWRTCFARYIKTQREYVEALDGWLSKFLVPEVELFFSGRPAGAPPLFLMCHDWLAALRRLPDKPVSLALKAFGRDVKTLWIKQGEEQQQKGKVDSLAKEVDKKVLALQKAENWVLESKLSDNPAEPDIRRPVEHLAGRKEMLDMFKKRLEVEKAKHHECMQETQRVTLNGFKMGFVNVFGSLTGFSKDTLKMYDGLLSYNEKEKDAVESGGKAPCIEGCQGEVECRQFPEVKEQTL